MSSLNAQSAQSDLSFSFCTPQEWSALMALAKNHGVKYLLFEGIMKLPKEQQPPSELMLHWYVDTVQAEERFNRYLATLEALAALMSENDLSMMVIKGYTIARAYPLPERREGGDIDIFLFGEYQKGDDLASRNGGYALGVSKRSKHSQFVFQGISVDNHKSFVADSEGLTPKLKIFYGRIEEKIQESTKYNDVDSFELGEQTIYTLKPHIAALHMIAHAFRHVVVSDVAIRHYCDWVVFFNYHRDVLDRDELMALVEECELGRFVANVEHFCERNLGYTPFFNFGEKYKIEQRARSIESGVMSYQHKAADKSNLLPIIVNSLKKMFNAQRYYSIYLGMNSYFDYLVPNIVSRIKQLCR
ncbi:MAG: nucleotidyltransferase family protein [Rikenellaceae bacterium]